MVRGHGGAATLEGEEGREIAPEGVFCVVYLSKMAGKPGSNPPQCRSVTRAGKRCSRRGAGGQCAQHRDAGGRQRSRNAASREADREGTPDLLEDIVLGVRVKYPTGETVTIATSQVEPLLERVQDLQGQLDFCKMQLQQQQQQFSAELEGVDKDAGTQKAEIPDMYDNPLYDPKGLSTGTQKAEIPDMYDNPLYDPKIPDMYDNPLYDPKGLSTAGDNPDPSARQRATSKRGKHTGKGKVAKRRS